MPVAQYVPDDLYFQEIVYSESLEQELAEAHDEIETLETSVAQLRADINQLLKALSETEGKMRKYKRLYCQALQQPATFTTAS